jgi:hypothetical protein
MEHDILLVDTLYHNNIVETRRNIPIMIRMRMGYNNGIIIQEVDQRIEGINAECESRSTTNILT